MTVPNWELIGGQPTKPSTSGKGRAPVFRRRQGYAGQVVQDYTGQARGAPAAL